MGTASATVRGFGAGRYRVLSASGMECRERVDPDSPVVECPAFPSVVRVSQAERLADGTLRLRTPEGWVNERDPLNANHFYLERLARDTDHSVGVGRECCVFAKSLVEGLRSPAHGDREELPPTVVTPPSSSGTPPGGLEEPVAENLFFFSDEHRQTTMFPLSDSVEVGGASEVTVVVELFVPSERSALGLEGRGGTWEWGITLGEVEIFPSTGRRPPGACPLSGAGQGRTDGPRDERETSMDVVLLTPEGILRRVPLRSEYRGDWMTLTVVARRSGECSLSCARSADRNEGLRESSSHSGDGALPQLGPTEPRTPGEASPGPECAFFYPTWFRGTHVKGLGLCGERPQPPHPDEERLPLRARYATMFLGAVAGMPLPPLTRIRELESLLETKRLIRRVEAAANPLFTCARDRQRRLQMRQLWPVEVSGHVNVVASSSFCESDGEGVCASSPSVSAAEQALQLTVSQPLLLAGEVCFGSAVHLLHAVGDRGARRSEPETRCITAWEHPALQTPERFDPVPLVAPKSSPLSSGGAGELWAWAPVPRSDAFLAMGLVFTTAQEPPSVTHVRCVRRELVEDAEAQCCQVVSLQRQGNEDRPEGEKSPGDRRDSRLTRDGRFCDEVIVVRETGLCVPKQGSQWSLSPRRVAVGCEDVPLGWRRDPRWDGAMPALTATAGQSVEINLGFSPFRFSMEGCIPVSEMAHADARFVVQVYDDAERMWRDVRHDGHLDVSVAAARSPPELVGSWALAADGTGNNSEFEHNDRSKFLENDVFTAVATDWWSVSRAQRSSSSEFRGGREGGMVRLPSARAGRALEVVPVDTLPPSVVFGEAPEVWGLSLRVKPLFPTNLDDANPWLRRRFEEFKSLVWEQPEQAQAVNSHLTRYVNAIATGRGLNRDILLSCEWAAVQPSHAQLADWPLLQSMESSSTTYEPSQATSSSESRTASPLSSREGGGGVLCDGGVEESKQSAPPARHLDPGPNDEWVLATSKAPATGIAILDAPRETAKVVWRFLPGQVLRLSPRLQDAHGRRDNSDGATQEEKEEEANDGWRRVDGVDGREGWFVVPPEDADDTGKKILERFRTTRLLLDGFSPNVRAGSGAVDDSELESGSSGAREALSPSRQNFWRLLLPVIPTVQTGGDGDMAFGASPHSAISLQGGSDALLTSARDVGVKGVGDGGDNGSDDRPLLVVGKWKIGTVTDTLTVTTRTSGCTRVNNPDGAGEEDVHPALAELDDTGSGAEDDGQPTEQEFSPRTRPLPILCDGIVCGFRAVDGLVFITRALWRVDGAGGAEDSGSASPEPVERRALAFLGSLEEGAEICFSVVDDGEDVLFSCQEVGGRQRAAAVRARCGDTWGRGRVALGARAAAKSSSRGWVRIVSQAHGATVRSGMSIDTEGIVGRIPCGTVVPYDNAIIFHSPSATDRGAIEPVVRYHCLATTTTPAGWISERGRFAQHPYRICERIRVKSSKQAHLLSHVSVGRICPPTGGRRWWGQTGESKFPSSPTLPRPHRAIGSDPRGGTPTCDAETSTREWRRRLNKLSVLPVRFRLLQRLNLVISEALPFLDLLQGDLWWSTTALLSRCRHLIFSSVKQELWQAELERTARSPTPQAIMDRTSPSLELRLSRGRAARQAEQRSSRKGSQRRCENEERHTLFGQAFLALRDAPVESFRLRPGEVLYNTVFLGEHAHDAGGPYRESFAEYCAELQSDALPLLIPCANAANDVGINREKWVPNPSIGRGHGLSPALHAEMMGFLGRLMGVAIRSHQPLDLDLPSIVWKQLARSSIQKHDLEAIDWSLTQSLSSIRAIDLSGVTTEQEFKDLSLGDFDVPTADGERVTLESLDAKSREITLANRFEFADKAEAFKMREFWGPVEAIRRGLGSVVPIQLLRLFCWDEVEVLVCGRKEVDVELLEACTEYSMCSRHDAHVSAFWDVLRSFSSQDKSLFLRFAWGRSRLPLSAEQFQQPFKIQAFPRGPADAFLPVAHTCFFSLDLPRYSSREVLEERLRYAIHNCLAIDADDTSIGRNSADMGWGDGP